MKNGLLIPALWLLITAAIAQKSPTVRWVRFEQLDSLQRLQPRPVFVYLHTSWCGYCRFFGRTTLRHADVIGRLNGQFYCVDFDAETTEPVVFRGKTYRFQPVTAVFSALPPQQFLPMVEQVVAHSRGVANIRTIGSPKRMFHQANSASKTTQLELAEGLL